MKILQIMPEKCTAGRVEGRAATGLRLPALRVRAVMALAAIALSAPLLAACGVDSHPGLPGNGSGLSVSPARSVEGPGSGGLGVGAAGTTSGMPGHGRLPRAVSDADAHDLNRYGEAWESAGGHGSRVSAAPRPVFGVAHPVSPAYEARESIWNGSGKIAQLAEHRAAPVGAPPAGVRNPLSSTAAAGDATGSAPASGRHLHKDSPRKRNLDAADLSTSWNRTRPVAAALGLAAPTTARAGALKRALGKLKASHAGTEGSAGLPGVPLESVSVLGERDGIAYGAWKGGPAGTMPVTFYFGPHDTPSGSGFVDRKGGVSPAFMAVLRRSTKIWTRRLASDGERRDITIKVVEGGRYKAVDTVEDVEGIVLQVRLNDVGRVSGGPIDFESGADGNRFMPVYGSISISSHVHDNLHDGMAHSVAHEFGHVLGISPYGFQRYKGTWYDAEAHTWSGPNALRANGGKPVPLQWVNGRKWWEVAEPHAEGARRDAAHLGVCSSVMAYCADTYAGGAPSELDFAILADFGFDVLDAKVAAETERYGHAAWGAWAAWGVSVERDLRDNFHGTPDDHPPLPHDFTRAYADAFGTAPVTTLSDNAALRGKAVWNGSLLGVDLGNERLPPVVGDAKLRVDLGDMEGELRLRNLTVHLGGGGQAIQTRPFRQPDLRYDVDISGNGFASARNRVQGGFHGPAHEEMAGVVRDVRSEVQLLGGFGGVRAATAAPGRHLQQNGPQTTNTRAADLRASWNDATPVTAAAGLAPLTTDRARAAKRALGRLRTLHAGTEGPKTALHKVPADAIAMLGEKDGIALGAWKGGTAGTMPIGLHLDAAPGLSEGSKAMLRRAAKIWSKHLVDDGLRHDVTLDDGTVVKDVEGVLVQIRLHNQLALLAGVTDYGRGPDGEGFRPISGRVRFSLETASRLEDGIASAIAHEIGHTLGATVTGATLFRNKYYDPQSHTWSGPNAMRANGGQPVPLQWLLRGRIVAPNTPGAIRDTHHLGPCTALLSSCFDRSVVTGPTALDLAFLADLGVAILAPDVAAETERYGYAAWGDWAAWGVGVERDLQSNHVQNPRDFLRAHADAFGTAPATALSDNAALRGKAVWNGSLLGVDLGSERLPPVVGDAKLRVDLDKLEGELRLSNLTVHADGGAAAFRRPALVYAVEVDGNGFAAARNRVQGSFHGPAHEEMAGVVKDTRARVGLIAGFGGVRDAD